jgi:acyl phosphate:glycerol-3-phosphate acyltransferase
VIMSAAAIVVGAYAVGSVNFALLLARCWGGTDLRRVGSGNPGAANVLRASGVRAGVLVAILDITKGAACVMFAARWSDHPAVPAAAGLAAIVGHVYPAWLKFRGGKGVATTCGVFTVLAPLAMALAASLFMAVVWSTKYVSLGSMIAILALPPLAYATGRSDPTVAAALVSAAIVVSRHRSNLARLRVGTERRLGARV